MTTIQASERDELAELLATTKYPRLDPPWKERAPRSPVKYFSLKQADALLAAGYRKPRLIQYAVVTQDGGVYDCSFGSDLEAAQAVAESATADARSVALDYTYRVAELVEL